jgi:nicotinamide-nucleotide amidase
LRADIVSIGTELIMGELVDTNAPYLAAQLPPMGIELQRITQAPDDLDALVQALQQAFLRSDLILTTGGLGPTEDDLSREAIALLLGEELYVDAQSLDELKEIFRQRGTQMPGANVKQANLIPSARPLPNTRGTAPGWWVEKDSKIIVAMPGPPNEMRPMWEVEVQPKLLSYASGTVIVTRILKTFGQPEAAMNEVLSPLFHLPQASLGIYAQSHGVQVRIRVKAPSDIEAREIIVPIEAEIRGLLGEHIWGADDQILEERIGHELRERGLTLATMESCTGGLLAHTITQVPGSSDYFRGGTVVYSNDVKVAEGVDQTLINEYGAVSSQVAQDMARAARDRVGADLGIGTTGVAGPGELEGKPPGTVHIGLAHRGGVLSFSRRHPPQRALVTQRTTTHALLELWRFLNMNRG